MLDTMQGVEVLRPFCVTSRWPFKALVSLKWRKYRKSSRLKNKQNSLKFDLNSANSFPEHELEFEYGEGHLVNAGIVLKHISQLREMKDWCPEPHLCRGVDYGVVHAGHGPVGLRLFVVARAGGVEPPPPVLRLRVTRTRQTETPDQVSYTSYTVG